MEMRIRIFPKAKKLMGGRGGGTKRVTRYKEAGRPVDSAWIWKEVEMVAMPFVERRHVLVGTGKGKVSYKYIPFKNRSRTWCNCEPQIVQNAAGYSDSLVETGNAPTKRIIRRGDNNVVAVGSVAQFHRFSKSRDASSSSVSFVASFLSKREMGE